MINYPDTYELVLQEELPDIHSAGYLFRHKKSGARVAVVLNDDENKVFHIAFRTTPVNSKGTPHIMEHSVLCGSRKYPSKDPFVELVKGSLNTFLNAMTYSDKTMYPVASCNEQDFKNLMDVYLDAVFYPNIYKREEIFRQEGWHYELKSLEDQLIYNGVVYNEMKGAFSSPEDILDRKILNSLFPDSTYGVESGGDPACIPDLSYEEFLDFHRTYYHPANSYIYIYGNVDMQERLEYLDREYLSAFDAIEVPSKIVLPEKFEEMHTEIGKYSISTADSEEDNTYLSFNAAIGSSLDVEKANAYAVIEYVLLSAPGAPLKQALLDAGLGKDISGSYDSGTMQPVFSITAKYANAEDKDRFVRVIREELERIVAEGLDQKSLMAGINSSEFRFREADFGSFPKGLMYGIDMMDTWLYDDNCPFGYLKQLAVFDFLKKQVGTGYYEDLIRDGLLNNPHTSLVVIEPEKGLNDRMEEELAKKLAAYKESLTEEERQALVEKTQSLHRFQETPSTKEELEAIPMLKREDIGKEAYTVSNLEEQAEGTTFVRHDYVTNGVCYLDLLFDMKYVPAEYIPYAGLLKSVLGFIDTENYKYGELFSEINIETGGIYANAQVIQDHREAGSYRTMFGIRTKALAEKMPFAFSMIEEILLRSRLDDTRRLYEIISEQKSTLQERLSAAGHQTAVGRALAYTSEPYGYSDALSGIGYYKLIEDLEAHFEERKGELVEKLKHLMGLLFRQDTLLVSVTCEEENYISVKKLSLNLKEKLETRAAALPPLHMALGQKNEGFLTAGQVQFVARTGNYRKAGLPYTGALRILKVALSYDYLWINIRVKGGAYGCMSGFGVMGDSYFASYRDPNLGATNEIYEGVTDYVKNFHVDERDMTKYVIGTISELDTPLTPRSKGLRSMTAWLAHITREEVQRERDEILSATEEDIQKLAPYMEAILKTGSICALGGEERMKKEKELFGELKPLIGGEEC